MVERQDNQHHIAFLAMNHTRTLLHIRCIVAVGQEDTFRVGCGTRSIADIRIIIGLNRLIYRLEILHMLFQIRFTHRYHIADSHLILAIIGYRIEYDDFLHFGAISYDIADLTQLLLAHDHIA